MAPKLWEVVIKRMMSVSKEVELEVSARSFTMSEVILLTGQSEANVQAEMNLLGISSHCLSGKESIVETDVRRLMVRLAGKGRQIELPGFSLPRLGTLMRRAIDATGLNLSGFTILTEAASGAYAATAVLAAMAGAVRVYAFVRPSRYGSVAEIEEWTMRLASFAGVADRISVIEDIRPDILAGVDIVTNSGHLRPLTANLIDSLPNRAVIALMFEAWELRPGDIDLEACLRRRIPVVGVNERHSSVDVFSFLGPLCVKQLHDSGFAAYGNRIALLCDNGFAEPMHRGLSGIGASVETFVSADRVFRDEWDAIVVALTPAANPRIGEAEARCLATVAPPEQLCSNSLVTWTGTPS